ncbi:MAG: hypothetical protein VST64_04690, partial [Nitrospirota bacterium]|nr:hypothetical protein [Nitrospirota bacterium]
LGKGIAHVVKDLSNPLSIHPQSDALSIELRARGVIACRRMTVCVSALGGKRSVLVPVLIQVFQARGQVYAVA